MARLVGLLSAVLLGSLPLTWAHRTGLGDVGTGDEASVVSKAQELLAVGMDKVNVSGTEVATILQQDHLLKEEVVNHVDGERFSSALVERARNAMRSHAGLDQAVRRKQTPCHCVIQKVEDVNMDRSLRMNRIGTSLNLDLDSFPVTAEHGPANIKLTDLDGEKRFWSEEACHSGCFHECKLKTKFHLDRKEMRLLGVDGAQETMVAAQCDGKKCNCLDMDRTKKYIKALKTVQKGRSMDIASHAKGNFQSESECLDRCKPLCEHVEDRFQRGYDDDENEVDWEGLCFDELHGA